MTDDLRTAIWQLTQHRWSSLMVIVCLGIGVAVVTSTASILDGVLLRPLPFERPDELVMIRCENAADSRFDQQVSRIDFWDWQHEAQSMELTAFTLGRLDLPLEGGFQRIFGLYVSPSFFEVLRIKPYLGVDFRDYLVTGNQKQIMIGTSVWRDRYAGRADIAGDVIEVHSWDSYPATGSQKYSLTGILPDGMRFLPSSSWADHRGVGPDRLLQFVIPLDITFINFAFRDWRALDVLGRLNPGHSIESAQAEMELICARLSQRFPETNEAWTARVIPLDEYVFADVRPFVFASSTAALLVFTIAVGSVIHILVLQYQRRKNEIAIRAAVGATPWMLVRQVLLEFAILLLISLLVGLWLGQLCTALLLSLAPNELRWLPTSSSLGVAGFIALLGMLAAASVWCLALRRVISPELIPLLGTGGRNSSGDFQSARVVQRMTQLQLIATYLLVLVASLVWLRTRELARIDPGFEVAERISMTLSLPQAKKEWKYNSVFCNDAVRRVKQLPAVRSASAILGLPMGNSSLVGEITVEGRPLIRPGDLPTTYVRVITDDYFETMGIPILRGRPFNHTDAIGEIGNNRTAIVSKTMAERCWPGKDPIGRRFKPFPFAHWMEVVGVVGDVRGGGLESGASIDIYYPEKLFPQMHISLVAHTHVDPMAAASQIRDAVLAADPDVHISDVRTLSGVMRDSQAERYFGLRLLTSLAVIGSLLAGFGIAVTTVHSIVERTDELKIREACGATPWDILGLLLRQHMWVVILAVCGGVVVAHLVVPTLHLPWHELRFFRTLAIVLVPLGMLGTSLLACLAVSSRLAFKRK